MTHVIASATLLLPQPLGPTIAVTPLSKASSERSEKDLNPEISSRSRRIAHRMTPRRRADLYRDTCAEGCWGDPNRATVPRLLGNEGGPGTAKRRQCSRAQLLGQGQTAAQLVGAVDLMPRLRARFRELGQLHRFAEGLKGDLRLRVDGNQVAAG